MQPGLLGQLCKSHPPETPTAVEKGRTKLSDYDLSTL